MLNAIYCAGVDAISLLSPGLKITRLGYTGVTSNDILSRTDRSATGLLLTISMRLSQGSILMRLPRGRAGTWATLETSRAGACANAPWRIALSFARRLPKCGLTSHVNCGERPPRTRRNRPAVASLSLYGDF